MWSPWVPLLGSSLHTFLRSLSQEASLDLSFGIQWRSHYLGLIINSLSSPFTLQRMEREAEGSKLLTVVYSIPGDHPLARSPPRVTWLDQKTLLAALPLRRFRGF